MDILTFLMSTKSYLVRYVRKGYLVRLMKRLNFIEAKHLVERAGIGAELERIQLYKKMSLDQAISHLLLAKPVEPIKTPNFMTPFDMRNTKRAYRKSGKRKKANKLYKEERRRLKNWGLNNLLKTDSPLHERMVWFWHNHFTSSIKKVRTADWMFKQDLLVRKHALGNFALFLQSIAFDPAMLIYLDGRSNKKGQPNENFARELLELFTLGEGHYAEADIKEAARAFTGWKVSPKKGKAVFRRKLHDDGVKQFMGRSGTFKGDDILSILLANPRTSEFICEKLWAEFISIDQPETSVIRSWAKSFRQSGYDISLLLKTIFTSAAFWDKKYQGGLIKSPIDLVIGSLRTLDHEDDDLPNLQINKQMKRMGQEIFAPPNVKGWEGGKHWIDDVKLPIRQAFLRKLTRGKMGDKKMIKKGMTSNMSMASQDISIPDLPNLPIQQWNDWLLPMPAVTNINKKKPQARLRAILLDPTFQLK